MPADPREIQDLFLRLVELAPADRPAALDRECGADLILRERLAALLQAHGEPDSYLDRPSADLTATRDSRPTRADSAAADEHTPNSGGSREPQASRTPTTDLRREALAGVVIAGRYTLQEKIGAGGMGEVWVARQSEPIKRKVALKLIKTGMDSHAVLQRFEQERQALALMDHPHIARVLDGGMTPTGQPFFVMELVNGLPLNKFCDEMKLTPKARLELFVPICQAVQHAHQKGIVHRDLKPANILVTLIDGRPVPRVIDFGVAKAISGKLTDETLSTAFGAVVGTLEYMSPEQTGFSGADVDTRADIYSLGVILYELLTGLRPIDSQRFQQAALSEMIRIIQEEEPSKPSTRLSTDASLPSLAALRRTEPRKLMAILRGELDWIVMKCLEKQRDRRYETATGLARDIQRFLNDEPVEARPPSLGYRLRKLVRRHRGPVLAVSLLVLALIGGLVGTTSAMLLAARQRDKATAAEQLAEQRLLQVQAEEARAWQQTERAEENERKAKQQQQVADAVREFLQYRLLNQADMTEQANALLMAGGQATAANPDITVRELLDRAAAELTADKIDDRFPGQPLVQMEILATVGETYRGVGQLAQALEFVQRAADLCHEHLGDDDPAALAIRNNLGMTLFTAGHMADGISLMEQVVQLQAESPPEAPLSSLSARNNLAAMYSLAQRHDQAMELARAVSAQAERTLGALDRFTLLTKANRAVVTLEAGRNDEALDQLERLRPIMEQHLGTDHVRTLVVLNNLLAAYYNAGRYDESIELGADLLPKMIDKLGGEHFDTLTVKHNLGSAYLEARQADKAIRLLEEVLEARRALLPPDHPHTLATMHTLGKAYRAARRLPDAVRTLRQAYAGLVRTSGPDHLETLVAQGNLATAHLDLGQYDQALPLLAELYQKLKTRDSEDPNLPRITANLAMAYYHLGQYDSAIERLHEVCRHEQSGPVRPKLNQYLLDAYLKSRRWSDAVAFAEQVVDATRRERGAEHPELGSLLVMLGHTMLKAQRFADAEPLLREGHAVTQKLVLGERPRLLPWQLAYAKVLLGAALHGQQKMAEAKPYLVDGFELATTHESALPPEVVTIFPFVLERLVTLSEALGEPDNAAKWRLELQRRQAADHSSPAQPDP